MQPLHQDILLMLGFCDATCQAYMVTRSRHYQLFDGMEYTHFPQWASGSTYIHVEPIQEASSPYCYPDQGAGLHY
jgi:hypothetical protein